MAIKGWKPGQLITLWIGVALAVLLLGGVGLQLINETLGPSICFGPCPEPTQAERVMVRTGAALLLLCVVAVLTMLIVTWKWFGARTSKNG